MPYKAVVGVPGAPGSLAVNDDDAGGAVTVAMLNAAIAAHNADPAAHGGMLMPAFISEDYRTIDGGVSAVIPIPVGSKHFTVEYRLNAAATPANLETVQVNNPAVDPGPITHGAAGATSGVTPFGLLTDIVARCVGGAVPDSIIQRNLAAPGNTIDVWTRFFT